MPKKVLRYKRKRISVVNIHGRDHLFIEAECIPASRFKQRGPYTSPLLPYQNFKSLIDLAKAVIDYRATGLKRNGGDKAYWYI